MRYCGAFSDCIQMCNLASCPSDKRVIKESNCGNNKIACCVTGKKKLCCPISMGDISPAMAEAIAQWKASIICTRTGYRLADPLFFSLFFHFQMAENHKILDHKILGREIIVQGNFPFGWLCLPVSWNKMKQQDASRMRKKLHTAEGSSRCLNRTGELCSRIFIVPPNHCSKGECGSMFFTDFPTISGYVNCIFSLMSARHSMSRADRSAQCYSPKTTSTASFHIDSSLHYHERLSRATFSI